MKQCGWKFILRGFRIFLVIAAVFAAFFFAGGLKAFAEGEGDGALYISQEKAAPASSVFYTDPDVGAGDLFFYTYLEDSYVPAYCLNFGKADPSGDVYTSAEAANELGYVMRHGYPNSNLDTYDEEARYATQIAVFIICGFDPWTMGENNAGNPMLPMADVADACGWEHAVEKGAALANAAKAYAASDDAKYAFRWNAPNELIQNMVTPSGYHSGFLRLSKTSAAPGLTEGHPAYSVSGAEYTVYSDSSCTSAVGVLRTGTSGNSGTIEVRTGTYYIRETKAPNGFLLSEEIIPVSVTEDATFTAKVSEIPFLYRDGLTIYKKSSGSEEEAKPLEGARFQITYDRNTEPEADAPHERTWIIETRYDEEEKAYIASLDPEHLVEAYICGTICEDPESALFLDGEEAVLPLGRLTVEEVSAPNGYVLQGAVIEPETGERVNGRMISGLILKADGKAELSFGSMLTVFNAPEEVPSQPETLKNIPKTGDSADLPFWTIAAAAALLIFSVGIYIILRRSKAKK